MSDIVIHVESLGKRYRIGERHRYKALRDTLTHALYAPVRAAGALFNGRNGHQSNGATVADNTFWSLKDVSFDIKQGEAVGVIGRNGAGKSTLLKILSRITKPTEGYAKVHGRVGSLLEVGTGFHPELTGRENIYLNGSIIGMKKKEIDRKFDEIVAFAEIEKFIDTPVKFYSSGMYIRLAFAVAAHLEPEILLVDEVLAVGDAAFQRKCIGKMGEVVKEGRTVLFVSHNMPSVQSLCERALLLRAGVIAMDSEPRAVIPQYLAEGLDTQSADVDLSKHPRRPHSRERALRRAWITDGAGIKNNSIMMGDSPSIWFEFRSSRPLSKPAFGFEIIDEHGRPVASLNNLISPSADNTFESLTAGVAYFHIPKITLLPGAYTFTLSLTEGDYNWVDSVERAISIQVQPADVYGSGKIPDSRYGVVMIPGCIKVTPEHDALIKHAVG